MFNLSFVEFDPLQTYRRPLPRSLVKIGRNLLSAPIPEPRPCGIVTRPAPMCSFADAKIGAASARTTSITAPYDDGRALSRPGAAAAHVSGAQAKDPDAATSTPFASQRLRFSQSAGGRYDHNTPSKACFNTTYWQHALLWSWGGCCADAQRQSSRRWPTDHQFDSHPLGCERGRAAAAGTGPHRSRWWFYAQFNSSARRCHALSDCEGRPTPSQCARR